MDCTEFRVDMRVPNPENAEKGRRYAELEFRLNHTMPMSEEYMQFLHEMFEGKIGEGSYVGAPMHIVCPDMVTIGDRCYINGGILMMARGGVTIEDDVQIAANVQLLANNHDLYDRQILTCKPVLIKEGAWIGAGATVLPGLCVGRHAVVGAASVVTKDVPDYAVVAGNPARIIKYLDPKGFGE